MTAGWARAPRPQSWQSPESSILLTCGRSIRATQLVSALQPATLPSRPPWRLPASFLASPRRGAWLIPSPLANPLSRPGSRPMPCFPPWVLGMELQGKCRWRYPQRPVRQGRARRSRNKEGPGWWQKQEGSLHRDPRLPRLPRTRVSDALTSPSACCPRASSRKEWFLYGFRILGG